MDFCPIAPIPYLERYCAPFTHHMILAQHLNDGEYCSWYNDRPASNTLILDNGAYEGQQLAAGKLAECIEELQPDYYVLPDVPNNYQKSVNASMEFLERYPELPGMPLWVVHADPGNLQQFVQSWTMGCQHAAGVCLSRLTNKYGLPNESSILRRAHFLDHIASLGLRELAGYVHCLGMLNGNCNELTYLEARGVNSVDSSAPIWRGLMGYDMFHPWPDFPLEMRPKVVASQEPIHHVNINLHQVKKAIRYGKPGSQGRHVPQHQGGHLSD